MVNQRVEIIRQALMLRPHTGTVPYNQATQALDELAEELAACSRSQTRSQLTGESG